MAPHRCGGHRRSGGIGAASARRWPKTGAVMRGHPVRRTSSERWRRRCRAKDIAAECHHHRCRVTNETSPTAWRPTYGSGGHLVNCAGVTRPVPHDDLDAWTTSSSTNLRNQLAGPICHDPHASAAAWSRRRTRWLMNISSVAAVTGQGSNVAYCASKAALDSMTRSLGRSLAPKDPAGVGVAGLGAGRIRSPNASRGHRYPAKRDPAATPGNAGRRRSRGLGRHPGPAMHHRFGDPS